MRTGRTIGIGLTAAWLVALLTVETHAGYPGWWVARGVADTDAVVTNNYSAVNLGQLKWFATNACEELEAHLPGGAGSELLTLVSGFSLDGNYAAVNVGQVKYVVSAIYDRLIDEGYTNAYPWTETTEDDCDDAACNIGQLKYCFDFDLIADTDEDDLPDWIERRIIGADLNDDIETLADVLPEDDFDGDGYLNIYEAVRGADPVNQTAVPTPTHYVSGGGANVAPFDSWGTAANTIQAALEATSPYDVVIVADGVYSCGINENEGYETRGIVFPSHPVTVRSLNGPERCIIDGNHLRRGVTFEPWAVGLRRQVLSGFTVRKGDTGSQDGGGGILCDGASPVIENCTIKNNIARSWSGGGVRCINGAAPVIRNCLIAGNRACNSGDGGGIAIAASEGTMTAEIADCVFSDNKAYRGGGLDVGNSSVSILGCTFTDNEADSDGGGISLSGCDASVSRCVVQSNKSDNYGGGVYSYCGGGGVVEFKACFVDQNEASASGGGIYLYGGEEASLENCAIARNRATGLTSSAGGGGVYFRGCDSMRIRHCTIADNEATKYESGGGVHAGSASSGDVCLIENSVVWGNFSPGPAEHLPQIVQKDDDLTLTVRYCDVEGGWSGGTQIRDLDPKVTARTYHLWADSPCIDAGAFSDVHTDFDGESRQPSRDRGSDEYIDDDSDGLADAWETLHFGTTATPNEPSDDPDGDGATNLEEYENGTDPTSNVDSDGDTLPDDFEVVARPTATPPKEATDPEKWDTDGDGLSDADDPNPNSPQPPADTDGNGLPDEWEQYYFNGLGNDAAGDPDNDGLNNGQELTVHTDPTDNDTDNDGLLDKWEVDGGLDPTDSTGLNGAQGDPDGDGLTNTAEQDTHHTEPMNWDSDGDMLDDGWEVAHGLDPTDSTGGNGAEGDDDNDGLKNFDEMCWGTNPNNPHSDGDGSSVGDGVSDGDEVAAGSDPTDADDEGDPGKCRKVKLTIGDDSSSNSERYALHVGNVRFVSPDFGTVASSNFNFVVGKSYSFEVKWIASNRQSPLSPDYDYDAYIADMPENGQSREWQGGNGVLIHDSEYVLGKHREEDFDYSAGKDDGLIYIIKVDLEGHHAFRSDEDDPIAEAEHELVYVTEDDGDPATDNQREAKIVVKGLGVSSGVTRWLRFSDHTKIDLWRSGWSAPITPGGAEISVTGDPNVDKDYEVHRNANWVSGDYVTVELLVKQDGASGYLSCSDSVELLSPTLTKIHEAASPMNCVPNDYDFPEDSVANVSAVNTSVKKDSGFDNVTHSRTNVLLVASFCCGKEMG